MLAREIGIFFMRTGAVCFFLVGFIGFLSADVYSGNTEEHAQIFRIPVWVLSETQPATMTVEECRVHLPPAQRLMIASRFLLGGMVYGWQFSYTPLDKTRHISEYFNLIAKKKIKAGDKRVRILPLQAKYPFWYCHAEYALPRSYADHGLARKSLPFKTTKGRGKGELKQELDGIYQAYREAAKNAVRNYSRKTLKNKPKGIIGDIFIKENPRLFIAAGYYVAELTVLIRIRKVIPYSVF